MTYYNGQGVRRNILEAFHYLKLSASQGYAEAQYHVGLLLFYGNDDVVEVDKNEAFHYFMDASTQGHVNARFYVGVSYAFGYGVEKNVDKAKQCFEHPSFQEDKYTQYILGLLFEEELNAFTYFKKSADLGHADAQYKVGFK